MLLYRSNISEDFSDNKRFREGIFMEEKISVQLTKETLFDFLLYHTYSKFAGFLTNLLGAAVGFMGIILLAIGKITWPLLFIYLAAAVLFIAYTPLQLKVRAKKQMEVNPKYREPSEYIFSDEGIIVIQSGETQTYQWETIQRAVATPKNIGVYWEKDNALIIPKESFGNRFVPIIQIIGNQIGRQNIKIR